MSLFAIGSYTEEASHVPEARGKGIYLIDLDKKGHFQYLSLQLEVRNPSYLCYDSQKRELYSIAENPDGSGAVNLFTLKDNNRLEKVAGTSDPGRAACHILHLADQSLVAVSSYKEGRLSLFPTENSRLAPALIEHRYEHPYNGRGPNPQRQEAPHAHQAVATPDGAGLVVVDLGSDRLWYHGLDTLETAPEAAFAAPAGYGPRHMAADPDGRHGYLLCELEPKLLVLRFAPDWRSAEITDELDTVGPEEREKAVPAAVKIHPSGKSLAVSNRFSDTIALFSIERTHEAAPRLTEAAVFPSGGKTPRDMEFSSDGSLLLMANQDSSTLASRRFDPERGLPLEEGPELELGTPVCIVELG